MQIVSTQKEKTGFDIYANSLLTENRFCHFMQIFQRRQFAWNVKAFFLEQKGKIFQNLSAENIT